MLLLQVNSGRIALTRKSLLQWMEMSAKLARRFSPCHAGLMGLQAFFANKTVLKNIFFASKPEPICSAHRNKYWQWKFPGCFNVWKKNRGICVYFCFQQILFLVHKWARERRKRTFVYCHEPTKRAFPRGNHTVMNELLCVPQRSLLYDFYAGPPGEKDAYVPWHHGVDAKCAYVVRKSQKGASNWQHGERDITRPKCKNLNSFFSSQRKTAKTAILKLGLQAKKCNTHVHITKQNRKGHYFILINWSGAEKYLRSLRFMKITREREKKKEKVTRAKHFGATIQRMNEQT